MYADISRQEHNHAWLIGSWSLTPIQLQQSHHSGKKEIHEIENYASPIQLARHTSL